jgi:protein-S-isoprenylcysteine O-methyltransferase Ste14
MYLGDLLILAGWAIWLANVVAFAGLPLFVAYINRFQIAAEERALQARYGAAYSAYRRAVRRWL